LEKSCKLLLFPFVNNEEEDVVECLLLPDIAVWIENDSGVSLNKTLLKILLLSCTKNRTGRMKYDYPGPSTKKSLVKERIWSVKELMSDTNRQLSQKLESKCKELEDKSQELEDLRSELSALKEELEAFKSKSKKEKR